jgi:CRP-like cAMP-binding protein
MVPSGAKEIVGRELEDALNYLPRKQPARYRRMQVIYDQGQPSSGLYLVVQGRVKCSTDLDDGSQAALGIFGQDEFFGEVSLIGNNGHNERATALDDTMVMLWPADEVTSLMEHQPKLGVALVQLMVNRCVELEHRLESLANDKTPVRIAKAIIHFADVAGTREQDGTLTVPHMTHQLIAEYVGTSREIVTFQMSQLRQRGFVSYTRKWIKVYRDALAEELRNLA